MKNSSNRDSAARLHELCWLHAHDAMFVMDCHSGIIVDANPEIERLTGFTRHELIGKRQDQLHPEAEREAIVQAFREGMRRPSVLSSFHLRRKDGASIPVATSMSGRFDADGRVLMVGVVRGIRELSDDKDGGDPQEHAVAAYLAAASTIVQGHSAKEMIQGICDIVVQEALFPFAWVGVVDASLLCHIKVLGAAGQSAQYLLNGGLDVLKNGAPVWEQVVSAVQTGTAVIVDDLERMEGFVQWCDRTRTNRMRSLTVIPFGFGDCRTGVLSVYSARPYAFRFGAGDIFVCLAEQVSARLEMLSQEERLTLERHHRETSQDQLSKALLAIVNALFVTLELRDSYSANHGDRVAKIACAVAREMGWPNHQIEGMRLAAMLHDIGKIFVPAEILNKPGPLNGPEWMLMKEHPQRGYDILREIPFVWPIAETVRQHHERLDGSGYPMGLRGDAILPEAKLLAIADVVDAISFNRSYRPALGIDAALIEIEAKSGLKLDGDMVRTCVRLFRDRCLVLP